MLGRKSSYSIRLSDILPDLSSESLSRNDFEIWITLCAAPLWFSSILCKQITFLGIRMIK